MKNAVMISIRPKWCELITSEEKTIELRKTRPKLETPFKCYIYCTKSKEPFSYVTDKPIDRSCGKMYRFISGGVVIGEFICDKIFPISIEYSDPNCYIAQKEFPYIRMTDKEIIDYLGNGKIVYSWHISWLKRYHNPQALSAFGLKRPPQSWCYVEELKQ